MRCAGCVVDTVITEKKSSADSSQGSTGSGGRKSKKKMVRKKRKTKDGGALVSKYPDKEPLKISHSSSFSNSNEQRKSIMKVMTAFESSNSIYGSLSRHGVRTGRLISFKDIEIREYARTVGDNPSCSSGPPVTITWEYFPEVKTIDVEQYERMREPRRSSFEMVLPRDVRHEMLKNDWAVTQTQIAAAVRANIKFKNQRRATVNNLDKASKMEEIVESAGRKLKRGFFFRKSTSRQVEELERQHEKARAIQATYYDAPQVTSSKSDSVDNGSRGSRSRGDQSSADGDISSFDPFEFVSPSVPPPRLDEQGIPIKRVRKRGKRTKPQQILEKNGRIQVVTRQGLDMY